MGKLEYSKLLKHPLWQKKRLEILSRDNWTCQLCGDTETEFHVHHKSYSGKPWEAGSENLISYCCICHQIVEEHKGNKEFQLLHIIKLVSGLGYAAILYLPSVKKNIVSFYSVSSSGIIEEINSACTESIFQVTNFITEKIINA